MESVSSHMKTQPRRMDARMARDSRLPSVALCYHVISSSQSDYLYSTTSARFAEHLDLISAADDQERAALRLAVTFDDGHRSAYENGLPLLERYSVTAMFFLTAGEIGSDADAMSWDQVRDLCQMGHAVGSHSWSHAFLTRCNDYDLDIELRHSKQTLEDKLGVEVDSISFPGGRWNSRVLRASARAGYKHAYCSEPWVAPQQRDGLQLHGRLMVSGSMDSAQLLRLCTLGSASQFRMRARSLMQGTVRSCIGDERYLWLWRLLANSGRKRAR